MPSSDATSSLAGAAFRRYLKVPVLVGGGAGFLALDRNGYPCQGLAVLVVHVAGSNAGLCIGEPDTEEEQGKDTKDLPVQFG